MSFVTEPDSASVDGGPEPGNSLDRPIQRSDARNI